MVVVIIVVISGNYCGNYWVSIILYYRWVDTVEAYGGLFHRVAGRMESILAAARRAGRQWLGGLRAGRLAFSTS